jgi:hypothetical protein
MIIPRESRANHILVKNFMTVCSQSQNFLTLTFAFGLFLTIPTSSIFLRHISTTMIRDKRLRDQPPDPNSKCKKSCVSSKKTEVVEQQTLGKAPAARYEQQDLSASDDEASADDDLNEDQRREKNEKARKARNQRRYYQK